MNRRIGLASVINAHFIGNSKQWLWDTEIFQNYIALKSQNKNSVVDFTTKYFFPHQNEFITGGNTIERLHHNMDF